jgi:hypothetical protein
MRIKLLITAVAVLTIINFGVSQTNNSKTMEVKKQYLEVVRFRLKEGVTKEQFLKAENNIRAGKIKSQKGYQGRDVYQDTDGTWLIVIRWDNKENADAWTPIFMTLQEGQAFGSLLDFSSARQEHYTLVNP